MDTIQELRRVLEIQLNYLGVNEISNQESTSPLSAVRQEITSYKRQLRIFTTISMVLGTLVCLAAIAAVVGATWIPWHYIGVLVVISIGGILKTVYIDRKLERVKKRELFLFMLHKMNKPSKN